MRNLGQPLIIDILLSLTAAARQSGSIRSLKRCQTQRTQYQRSQLNNAMQCNAMQWSTVQQLVHPCITYGL